MSEVNDNKIARPLRIGFISLGCAKNLVDSEKMLGLLAEAGCEITTDPDDADVLIVNTCGFLAAARAEAHEAVTEAVSHKTTGRCRRVVVAGCLVQRDGEKLLFDVPGIDALVGINDRDRIVDVIRGSGPGPLVTANLKSEFSNLRSESVHPAMDDTARLRLTPKHYAYLKISDGCDQKCTFCTIPMIRGSMRSKPIEQVLNEARELIADGAVEINLIGQDTTQYGRDLGFTSGLSDLLQQMDRLDGVRWVRLMYAYPTGFSDELIEAIAQCHRIVKYVDLPLQHVSDRILKAMHRGITKSQTLALMENIRRRVPGVSIRTTLMVGFPGETDEEFEELVEFVRDVRLEALGVFSFSPEPDTPAGRMKNQIPEPIRQQRAETIMREQQAIAFEQAQQQVGRVWEVMVENDRLDGMQAARHSGQAPEVDSRTWIRGGSFQPGEFIQVRCVGAHDYDLIVQPTGVILPRNS